MTGAGNLYKAPDWNQLPEHVHNDFNNAGFGNWYQEANNDARLTLVNNYVKMRDANLWQYVNAPACLPHETKTGALEFLTRDIDAFRNNLYERNDFSNPAPLPLVDYDKKLASREYTDELSLHFKTFNDWPKNRIEAHIDQYGIIPSPQRIMELAPLGGGAAFYEQLGKHFGDYAADGYTKVHDITGQLQNRGFGLDIPFGHP